MKYPQKYKFTPIYQNWYPRKKLTVSFIYFLTSFFLTSWSETSISSKGLISAKSESASLGISGLCKLLNVASILSFKWPGGQDDLFNSLKNQNLWFKIYFIFFFLFIASVKTFWTELSVSVFYVFFILQTPILILKMCH